MSFLNLCITYVNHCHRLCPEHQAEDQLSLIVWGENNTDVSD